MESEHRILIDENGIKLYGMEDVLSFNETSFEGVSTRGTVQVTGQDMRMVKTAIEEKEVVISGKIISVYYPEGEKKKGKFRGIFG